MTHTVWVINSKSGVGRSVLTMVLAWQYETAGRPLWLIDLHNEAHLAAFMGHDRVLSLQIGASYEDLRTDPSLAYGYWDLLAAEIIERNSGVDLGAKVSHYILDWAKMSHLDQVLRKNGVSMDIYVPITSDPLAVAAGIDTLEAVEQIFPTSRRVLVLNETAGPFDAYADTPEFMRILAMRDRGLYVVLMEHCPSEAWTDFERMKLPPGAILAMDARTVAETTGLGLLAARRAMSDYAAWLGQMGQALAPMVSRTLL